MDEAAARYEEAITLLRGMDEPLRLANTVRHLGDVTRHAGRFEDSLRCYEEALAIYRSHSETVPLDLGNALRGHGLLKEAMGDRAAAREIWMEVLEIYRGVGVQAGVEEAQRRVAQLTDMPTSLG